MIRDDAFYEAENEARRYYYYVDMQGRLFTEQTLPKNIATCLKGEKFLDFFFRQVRPNPAGGDYAWLSPCGKESNFIDAADTAIVFTELERGEGGASLIWGGTQRVAFEPERLRVSEDGRLYHLIETKRGGVAPCLVRASVALVLAEGMELGEESGATAGTVEWEGRRVSLQWLDETCDGPRRPSGPRGRS